MPDDIEIAEWLSRTPEEWADLALDRALVKRTRRPHLRPALVATIRDAMDQERQLAALRAAPKR